MRVNLSYFKETGKWYSDGTFNTDKDFELFEIWDIVKKIKSDGRLPGLMEGHSSFIVLVDVPNHPNRHPRLIL